MPLGTSKLSVELKARKLLLDIDNQTHWPSLRLTLRERISEAIRAPIAIQIEMITSFTAELSPLVPVKGVDRRG